MSTNYGTTTTIPPPLHLPPPPRTHDLPPSKPHHHHHHHHSNLSLAHYPDNPITTSELVELRALQRTFSGAYLRTSLSQFTFALIILKIFTPEFYSIGALFAAFGASIYVVSLYRAKEGNHQFFLEFVASRAEKDRDREREKGSVRAVTPPRRAGDDKDDDDDDDDCDYTARTNPTTAQTAVTTTTTHPSHVPASPPPGPIRKFKTSGNVVLLVTILSVAAYVTLLVLVIRLP